MGHARKTGWQASLADISVQDLCPGAEAVCSCIFSGQGGKFALALDGENGEFRHPGGEAQERRTRAAPGLQYLIAGRSRDRGREQNGIEPGAEASAGLAQADPASKQAVVGRLIGHENNPATSSGLDASVRHAHPELPARNLR